jgi:hypothetical protein
MHGSCNGSASTNASGAEAVAGDAIPSFGEQWSALTIFDTHKLPTLQECGADAVHQQQLDSMFDQQNGENAEVRQRVLRGLYLLHCGAAEFGKLLALEQQQEGAVKGREWSEVEGGSGCGCAVCDAVCSLSTETMLGGLMATVPDLLVGALQHRALAYGCTAQHESGGIGALGMREDFDRARIINGHPKLTAPPMTEVRAAGAGGSRKVKRRRTHDDQDHHCTQFDGSSDRLRNALALRISEKAVLHFAMQHLIR